MMKKILTLLIGIMLLMPAALAFNAPPIPMPFVTYYSYNGPIIGMNVDFTCNGKTITKTTNELGGILVELGQDFGFKCTSIVSVNCGYDVCNKIYNVDDLSYDGISYVLSEAPPPECTVDSDCATGYECINEKCELIPEPEPVVEDKVSSNTEGTIASIESNFGDCIDVVITDNKLTKLFDGLIDFDTEDYDTHEEIKLKACSKTSLDNADYGLEPYVLIEEGAIEYRYVFDDLLPVSEVADDEELEINFLDEDIEIISLSSSKMIIRHGEVYLDLKEGEEITYEGKTLKIGVIDSDFVYVTYNGESEKIFEDEIGELGGIQVYVDEAVPNKNGDDLCSLRIAEDIEEVIEDGDEYNENWDYSIGEGYIGIKNSEEFKYLDEENKPLKLGDSVVLPNDFATIKLNEVSVSDTTEIDIKIKDIYLNVKGERSDGQDDSFSFNNKDYEELFVGDEGILDEDKVFISSKVRIGESDVYLEAGSIIIGDLVIELGFMGISYKGVSFDTKEDNYLTYEGIIFKNPEGSVDNEETFQVIVPDEIPEITITINSKKTPAPIIIPEPEEIIDEPTEPIIEPVTPPVIEPIPPVVEPEPIVEDEQTVWNSLFGLLVKILAAFGFGAGFLGLLRYWWKKDRKRALKMAQTAIGRALLGKYDQYKK